MKNFKGKTVVISGAASGIGRALALQFAERGAKLLLADIDAQGLETIVAALRAKNVECHGVPTDTGREEAIVHLAAECSRLLGGADIVINNAGVTLVSPVQSLTTADAEWLMNINFWGVVHGCRAFLPQLRTRPEALLVNISSIFAMVSVPTQSIYNASKAAVRGFSDALREELRGTRVGVLCVHPGGIRTNIANKARIVDASMIAPDAETMCANFQQIARTTAEEAAAAIIKAIEHGKTRLLIGADAKMFDYLYRLAPTYSSKILNTVSHLAGAVYHKYIVRKRVVKPA
ncbi:MAG TPA: SDR family NAD(P)-dependent oxidoreductase [Rhodocyclaceae bacterium]|nr:SDR family NAD(P)-dependent oxidoreductase [Rhodocyclaceae bacterium]